MWSLAKISGIKKIKTELKDLVIMHETNGTMEVVKCFEIIKVDIKHLLHDFVYFDKFMHMDDRLSYNIGKF